VAENEDDSVPLFLADLKTSANQRRADTPVLEIRQDRHWCER